MINLLLHWIVSALVLVIIAMMLPGIEINNFGTALFGVFMLGVINMLIRPVLAFLTLPINLLTLGLFSFVLNAMMFALAAWFVPGFEVSSFWSALLGSFLLAIFTGLISNMSSGREVRS